MSDDSELWKDYKEAQQDRRAKRLPIRTEQILSLRSRGLQVKQLTPYQFRINASVDVWPIHNRYHNLNTNERGGYKDIFQLCQKFFSI